jgi:uncharacterized protein involved in type VI secretion and phage assembly
MADGSLDLDPSQTDVDDADSVTGVAVAKVIDNIDIQGTARVQISLPWLPGFEPWARVAAPMAGMGRGTYFIPQVGDEVLVAFNQGDIREPYILGSLWSSVDKPPALLPADPINKRIIQTPLGHKIQFDDLTQEISITSSTMQTITMGLKGITISAGTAPPPAKSTITMDVAGNITIDAKLSLSLKAPSISISGKKVDISGDAATTVKGGAKCAIQGGIVNIN